MSVAQSASKAGKKSTAKPAAAVALVLVLSGRLVGSRSASAMSVWLRGAILFAVGVAVLAAGLVLWGDRKSVV